VAPVTSTSPNPIRGNVTVERFIPALRRFRFLSSSVNASGTIKQNWMEGQNNSTTNNATYRNDLPGYGTQITGKGGASKGFDQTVTNNPSLFTFNNATQQWGSVQDADSTGLTAGSAWRLFVRGDRSTDLNNNSASPSPTVLRITGTLVTGQVTFNNNINATAKYYSLVGNPYASAVDWNSLTKVGLIDGYSVSDPTLSTGSGGAYVTWSNGLGVPSNTSSSVNGIIQPGQAFFVSTSGDTPTPSLTFTEEDKSDITNTAVFRTADTRTLFSVQLLLKKDGNSESTADGLVSVFDEEYQSSIDGVDAYKITNTNENIAINRNGTALSIEARAVITGTDTIPLQIWKFQQNEYWLKLDGKNFPAEISAFVKDAFLKTETSIDLDSTTFIPFNITNDPASSASDRFMVIFKNRGVLSASAIHVKAYLKNSGIQIDWSSQTDKAIENYQVEKSGNARDFEKVAFVPAKDNAATNNYSWFDASPYAGLQYYRVKMVDKSGEVHYSKVVKVAFMRTGEMTILSNPVKDNVIALRLAEMETGQYTVQLFNNAGQALYTGTLKHANNSAQTYYLPVSVSVSKGMYRLQLSSGKIIRNEPIIFQ
jgi:hypothetical protein